MPDTSVTSTVDDARPLKPSLGKRLRKLPLTLYLGGTLVSLFVLVAMVSFVWTPYPANKLNLTNRLAPPGTPGFLFGTDRAGRDVVTELMLGARNSLYVSVVSTIVAMFLGALIGLSIAGSRRTLQGPFTRLVDAGLALPGILTALVLAAKLGPGNTTATLAIITWQVPVAARVTIGPARQILALDYVEAAYGYGRTKAYVLRRHVLPNISPLLIVLGSVMFAAAILIEAALAFLSVGVQPPTSSWGRFLNETQSLLEAAPYLMFFPGVAIVLTALGFNLLGDGLRTVLDPQQARTGVA
ncbi:ABC transporter permease [Actinomycetes bacterium]|jgi:peptide/nickel transport system permease protein|nr:ABC transporter permease [Actinomycetes bacterium]